MANISSRLSKNFILRYRLWGASPPARRPRYAVSGVVENHVVDMHVLARIDIDTVVVRVLRRKSDIPDRDILRKNRVHAPRWGIGNLNPIDQDVLAPIKLHHARPNVVPGSENAVNHGHIFLINLSNLLCVTASPARL